jgi:hypothetical protein
MKKVTIVKNQGEKNRKAAVLALTWVNCSVNEDQIVISICFRLQDGRKGGIK